MEKYNTTEKEWLSAFESSDSVRIMQCLNEVRDSGSVRILPVLFDLAKNNTDLQIRNEIATLISEIKSTEAVPVIAESLSKHDFGDFLNALVAACWQSGLDFSQHLIVFAELFIRGDYKTALEAFTVIEESLEDASEAEIHKCLQLLKDGECMVTNEKLPLLHELRKVMQ
jgi:HEAT repeat protein